MPTAVSTWKNVWEIVENSYDVAIEENVDDRTRDWFLVYSPWPPFTCLALYLLFCFKARSIMKDREPFQINVLLRVYNTIMVGLSSYMVYEYFMSSYLASYSLLCQPVDYSRSPLAMRMASVSWWFFISKYVETLDTVFFVMRKKFNQVTFLHVFHHSTMLINWWLAVRYTAGGQSFLVGLLNSFVHVFMYTYYAFSSFGPAMKKYLWWKKYITLLQLVQFVCILIHCIYNFFDDCDFPNILNVWVSTYMVIMITFFIRFYIQSYLATRNSKKIK